MKDGFEKGGSRLARRYEAQKDVVKSQADEIARLKRRIAELEAEAEERDGVIDSISPIRDGLSDILEDLAGKRAEYDGLVRELKNMMSVMDRTVFRGRWRLARLLLK